MAKVLAFLADGSEEVESLAVLDVLVRAGINVTLVSCLLYTSWWLHLFLNMEMHFQLQAVRFSILNCKKKEDLLWK